MVSLVFNTFGKGQVSLCTGKTSENTKRTFFLKKLALLISLSKKLFGFNFYVDFDIKCPEKERGTFEKEKFFKIF